MLELFFLLLSSQGTDEEEVGRRNFPLSSDWCANFSSRQTSPHRDNPLFTRDFPFLTLQSTFAVLFSFARLSRMMNIRRDLAPRLATDDAPHKSEKRKDGGSRIHWWRLPLLRWKFVKESFFPFNGANFSLVQDVVWEEHGVDTTLEHHEAQIILFFKSSRLSTPSMSLNFFYLLCIIWLKGWAIQEKLPGWESKESGSEWWWCIIHRTDGEWDETNPIILIPLPSPFLSSLPSFFEPLTDPIICISHIFARQ